MNNLLTPLELKVMNVLWKLEKGFVKDIIENGNWDGEKVPKYNTVSTIVRILVKKEYVGHKAYGRSHEYFPIISKMEYQTRFLKNAINNVFSGSMTSLLSTLVSDNEVSQKDIDDLKRLIEDK